MRLIYSFVIQWVWYGLHILYQFNTKLKLFVDGRKKTISIIKKHMPFENDVIWLHAASLGEYEQGLPVLEGLKRTHAQHKIILTFFSPSGFEVKKNKTPADMVFYLPIDTHSNAKLFLDWLNPKMAIFIKYEIWPNYLYELKKRNIPTLLVSGIF